MKTPRIVKDIFFAVPIVLIVMALIGDFVLLLRTQPIETLLTFGGFVVVILFVVWLIQATVYWENRK